VKRSLKLRVHKKEASRPLGGQKGHSGSTLNKVEDPDELSSIDCINVKYCGHNIEESELIDYKTRQEFNIVVRRKVTEHRAEIKKCPYCNCKNKADFPRLITKPVQYGITVLSTAIYLRNYQLIPYNRIKIFLEIFLD